ncbi:MAG: class II glutamine amidotransferase [Myxococcales bacterium]|nr:class II glutamine amidotransferase [Myxococcales bacterium]
MGLLLACMINRAELLGRALLEESEALHTGLPGGADGCGAGFYQAGEVLHRKRPRPIEGELDWAGVLDGIRSHLTIAHVRTARVADRRAENTQPFRMRQWLFAHVGEIPGFAAIRAQLLESLPDFLRRNIRGNTDSEVLFHVVLSFLHDAGQLDANDVDQSVVVGALRSSLTLVDRHTREVGAAPSGATLALTDGRQLYALRRGSALSLIERDRLPARGSESPGGQAADVRYVLIASAAEGPPAPGYRSIQEGEVLCVDRNLTVTSQHL